MRRVETVPVYEPPANASEPTNVVAGLSILIVDSAMDELLVTMTRLSKAGFRVTVAETFFQAKPLLSTQPPSVLLAGVRLGAYNGLHLVLRGKAINPQMAALVTSPLPDTVLQAEAEAMGATFVVTPVTAQDLVAAVLKTYFNPDPAHAPIRPPYERRVGERRSLRVVSSDDERRSTDRRRVLPWLVTGIAG